MCYFITIGVPDSAAAALKKSVARGLRLDPGENHSIAQALPTEYRTFELTSGMCSCDLYHSGSVSGFVTSDERLRKKYAKRGWSAAKIERALADGTSQPAQPEFVGLRPDVATWLAAAAGNLGPLAVIVHWYRGRTDQERIPLSSETHVSAADLAQGLADISKDTVVWIDRP